MKEKRIITLQQIKVGFLKQIIYLREDSIYLYKYIIWSAIYNKFNKTWHEYKPLE